MMQQLPDGYTVTTEKARMQPERIHRWLSERSHWSKNIPLNMVRLMIDNSFTAGVMQGDQQIGFARLITDYASFAYLADVYVEEAHRGLGLSKQLMHALMSQPWIPGIRRLMLSTKDAHGLYAQFGFAQLHYPERIMEILRHHSYPEQIQEHDLPSE